MKLAIAAIAVASLFGVYMMSGASTDMDSQFQTFVATYRKSYFSQEEYKFRMGVFAENMKEAERLNSVDTATYGMNQFSDWTNEEFQRLNGAIPQDDSHVPLADDSTAPQGSADWRNKGVMTPVKDQGSCGSCWAFSATETLEAVWKLEKNQLNTLSEQELVDCSRSYGNHGCSGGWMYWAYDYVKAKQGLDTESVYPYHAKDETCKAQLDKHVEPISGYKKVATKSASLQSEVDKHPVAVAVDASKWSAYTGGVLTSCGSRLNHAVVAVGYESNGTWIVRNSWGQRWGESGYIRLAAGNTCGILNKAYVPTL
jgi:C1A family cysteine protease